MLDIGDLLKNDTVKGALQKFGLSEEKMEPVAELAVDTVSKKAKEDPSALIGLLSGNKNTSEQNVFAGMIEGDFMSGLIQKVGLSPEMANKVKGVIPIVLSQFSGKIKDSIGGGIMDKIGDMLGGDDKKDSSSGGLGSMIGGMFGK